MTRGLLLSNDNRFATVRGTAVIAGCAALFLLSGCAERKARAFPWASAVLVRPLTPIARSSDPVVAASDIDPDFRVEVPNGAPRIFSGRPVPPRPRGAVSANAEPSTPAKSADLVPELSPQESAAAKEQTAASIGIAERNVAAARGKNLSPTQVDTLSKISGFLAESREASNEGDWARARNLARKAQILSQDLIASL
jgi:hypothetical protein